MLREVEARIDAEQATLIIGSPPCTKFSVLQNLVRSQFVTPEQEEKIQIDLGKAARHITFCVALHKEFVDAMTFMNTH